MIFKSKQVNLDATPWVVPGSVFRYGYPELANEATRALLRFDPRPEFESTRDPLPVQDAYSSKFRYPAETYRTAPGGVIWAPRREQFDTPVNPILTALRDWLRDGVVTSYGSALWKINNGGIAATVDQFDHARRVLSRLANWPNS